MLASFYSQDTRSTGGYVKMQPLTLLTVVMVIVSHIAALPFPFELGGDKGDSLHRRSNFPPFHLSNGPYRPPPYGGPFGRMAPPVHYHMDDGADDDYDDDNEHDRDDKDYEEEDDEDDEEAQRKDAMEKVRLVMNAVDTVLGVIPTPGRNGRRKKRSADTDPMDSHITYDQLALPSQKYSFVAPPPLEFVPSVNRRNDPPSPLEFVPSVNRRNDPPPKMGLIMDQLAIPSDVSSLTAMAPPSSMANAMYPFISRSYASVSPVAATPLIPHVSGPTVVTPSTVIAARKKDDDDKADDSDESSTDNGKDNDSVAEASEDEMTRTVVTPPRFEDDKIYFAIDTKTVLEFLTALFGPELTPAIASAIKSNSPKHPFTA